MAFLSSSSSSSSSVSGQYRHLELNVISAQDLKKVTLLKKMQAYGVAWINVDNKLSTQIDRTGGPNPTWNDKVIFRVEEGFLRSETSAITVEIYCIGYMKDTLVGTARIMVSNLLKGYGSDGYKGMSFCVVQVRLPSGRPQGILNLGAMVLSGEFHMLNSFNGALGFRDLTGRGSQPQTRTSALERLLFMRARVDESDDMDSDSDEEVMISTACRKGGGYLRHDDHGYEGRRLEEEEKEEKECGGCCHFLVGERLGRKNMIGLRNAPAKIHLSPSDEDLCCGRGYQDS